MKTVALILVAAVATATASTANAQAIAYFEGGNRALPMILYSDSCQGGAQSQKRAVFIRHLPRFGITERIEACWAMGGDGVISVCQRQAAGCTDIHKSHFLDAATLPRRAF